MEHSQQRHQQEPIYNNDEQDDGRNHSNQTGFKSKAIQDENDTSSSQVVINEVNSPYSQAAILQAAPSLMSIRSCFVSSPSQAAHPPTHPAIGKHLHNQQTTNSKLQKKQTNQTSHQQPNSSSYRSNESSKNSVQQPMPISHSSIGNLQQTQSQPHLSSPCYSSQPFLAASNGNNPYKKQPPMPSQTVLQYKNGVLQLTSISGGQYGPRGMSSSADKLTLSAAHHNSNTSLPFHEQVKNLSKLVKTNQNLTSKQASATQSTQNVSLSGNSNHKLDSSSNNSVNSIFQNEIDVECATGILPSTRIMQVGNLFGNIANKVSGIQVIFTGYSLLTYNRT